MVGNPWINPQPRKGDTKGIFQDKRVVFFLSAHLLGCGFGGIIFSESQQMNMTVSGRKFCLALLAEPPAMKRGNPGEEDSWHNVVKLDHANPNKPLSKCDQKLPIIFIGQEIFSLRFVETNEPLHIPAAFSLYKMKRSIDILLPPAGTGCLHKAFRDRDFFFS